MRSRTATWFETKIRYEKTIDDGSQKKVSESYVVDALSFTEAENTIIEEMSAYISGDFKVTDLKQASYGEIFFSDADSDDKWYKCKLQFITIDEKTEREKHTQVYYLVQASSFDNCKDTIRTIMERTIIDYQIASVSETKVIDVIEHEL